mmetsp:Transcript_23416/g.54062  ORF Transcript_23416/g.54062 Transcript_23416/m.54062 type:complete len:124 (+) Transcript_23416:60-431(+)
MVRSPLAYVILGSVLLFGLQQCFVPTAQGQQLRGMAPPAAATAVVLGAPAASFAFQAKPSTFDLEWAVPFTLVVILALGSVVLPGLVAGALEPPKTMADVPKSDPMYGAFVKDRAGENPLLKQ